MVWCSRGRLFSIGLLMALTLAHPPAHAASGQITVALGSDVLSLDPTRETTIHGMNVFLNVFDQLTAIDADGSVSKRLASAIELSPDATVWTVTLRPGAKFHDGEPVTIDDVVWTYKKIMDDPKSLQRPFLSKVKSIEKLDESRMRFTLTEPFVPFDRQLSLISILPKKAYEQLGPEQFSVKPVGSGAYKVVRWVKDSQIELEANQDYWDGAPKVQKIFFRPVPSEASRVSGLLSGELDIVPVLPPTLIPRVAASDDVVVQQVKSNRTTFLGFNHAHPLLKDVKFRQAVDAAIDRATLTKVLLRGSGEPVGQVGAPVIFGFDPSIEPTAFDPERAKKLLAESTYRGEPITIDYPNNRLIFGEQVVQAIAGYMRAVGINVELKGTEFAAFYPAWFANKFPGMFFYGIGMSAMDSDLLVGFQYESGVSHGYWSSAEVDELIKRQRGEPNPEERKKLLSQIWRISQDQVVYSALYNEIQSYGVRKGIKWQARADERLRFHEAEVSPAK